MTSTKKDSNSSGLTISESDLCRWLGQALPGDVLQYHRGYLALDNVAHRGRLSAQDRIDLARVARRAFWASEQGLAHLLQRRNGPDDYTYLIVARSRPVPERKSIQTILAETSPLEENAA